MSKRERREWRRSLGLNAHHIRPSSRRGGCRRNLVLLPVEWHANWHKLFVNMTVNEVHAFIDIIMQPDTEWTYKNIDQLREYIKRGGR